METIIKNNWYPLQLWLSTIVFVAPILLIISDFYNKDGNSDTFFHLDIIILIVVFGLVFSGPALLAIWLMYELLFYKIHSALWIKILLSLISIAGVFITFSVLKGSMAPKLELVYSASIIVSSFFFKVRKVRKMNTYK